MAGLRRPTPGFVIKKCTIPGTVAIGFDDGPWFYTTFVLDVLKRFNAHATFFILPTPRVLDNAPAVDDLFMGENEAHWAPIVRRIHHDGHQVALHGYAHEHFDAMAPSEVIGILERSAMHFARPRYLNGLGPMYVRPPWGECNDADDPNGCLASLTRAGYRVVFWDTDPRDWENDSEFKIHKSKDILRSKLYDEAADPSHDSFLLVSHDVHLQTAINMTEAVLQMVDEQGYRAVTVGECVGEARDNWYRSVGADESTSQTLGLPSFSAQIPHATISVGMFVVLVGILVWTFSMYKKFRHQRAIRHIESFKRIV